MVIKITNKQKNKNHTEYKSSKYILTPKDIKEADNFDIKLMKFIKDLEKLLLNTGIVSKDGKKIDPLSFWYIIGKKLNSFIRDNKIEKEEEQFFWNQFFNHTSLIHRKITKDICLTRNDFKTAKELCRYPLKTIRKVGPWSMWRDILIYKVLLNDRRILDWVVQYFIKEPKTVHGSRPFLKAINQRFKKMETTILSDEKLFNKIKEIKIIEKNTK